MNYKVISSKKATDSQTRSSELIREAKEGGYYPVTKYACSVNYLCSMCCLKWETTIIGNQNHHTYDNSSIVVDMCRLYSPGIVV